MAPSLLPPLEWIARIEIDSPRYWSISIPHSFLNSIQSSLHQNIFSSVVYEHRDSLPSKQLPLDRQPLRFYLKRRAAYFDYDLDPQGYRSLPSHSLFTLQPNFLLLNRSKTETDTNNNESQEISHKFWSMLRQKNRADFFRAFSADESLHSFTKYLCQSQHVSNDNDQTTSQSNENFGSIHTAVFSSLSTFCTTVLYDCLINEKPEMLPVYLFLYNFLHDLRHESQSSHRIRSKINTFDLWNVKLLLQLYSLNFNEKNPKFDFHVQPLLPLEFIATLKLQLSAYFHDVTTTQFSLWLKEYFNLNRWPMTNHVQTRKFSWYLTYFELPTPDVISKIRSELDDQQSTQSQNMSHLPSKTSVPSTDPLLSSITSTQPSDQITNYVLIPWLLQSPTARHLSIPTLLHILDYFQ